MKLLLWAGIIIAVIWILRSKKSSAKVDASHSAQTKNEKNAEAMLSCAHCKTYFPASDAVFDSSRAAFCSTEHLTQHADR